MEKLIIKKKKEFEFRLFVILLPLLFFRGAVELAAAEAITSFNDNYSASDKITDLSFDLQSEAIQNLISEKIVTSDLKDFKLKFYWIRNRLEIEIVNGEKLSEETKNLLKKEYRNFLHLIIPEKFGDFILGYENKGIEHGWENWEDPTGLKDISLIKIQKKKKQLTVIQKKTTGTIKTNYFYAHKKWARGKRVLTKVEQYFYEGVQNIKAVTQISYKKFQDLWLPSTMMVQTQHILNQYNDQDYTRTIDVKYEFRNYRVNEGDALRWFSRQ